MLRTTDIDSGQPLLAEHCRYGTTDFTSAIALSLTETLTDSIYANLFLRNAAPKA